MIEAELDYIAAKLNRLENLGTHYRGKGTCSVGLEKKTHQDTKETDKNLKVNAKEKVLEQQ